MNKNLRESGLSLFELRQALGLTSPSHGYTIAEKNPEVVTAPGVYFPIKRGRVIPLKAMAEGGVVKPKTMIEKMEEAIDTPTPNVPLKLSPGPYEKGNKGIPGGGGVAREWTGPTPWKKNIPVTSRQEGGNVNSSLSDFVPKVNENPVTKTGMPTPTTQYNREDWPLRVDGTKKGLGYFGVLPMTDGSGRVASEYTVGVNFDGTDMIIPSMVPTLSKEELNYILGGGKLIDKSEMGNNIIKKAVEHAKSRKAQGLSPFAQEGEQTPAIAPITSPTETGGAVNPTLNPNNRDLTSYAPIPLISRQGGGVVEKVKRGTMLQRMLDEANIMEPEEQRPMPYPYKKGESIQGGIPKEWTGPKPWRKNMPLIPRQYGGEVDPRLFKETFSVGGTEPIQEGLEAARNTAMIKPTSLNLPSPPPEGKLGGIAPSITTSAPSPTEGAFPPRGMAEYEANVARTRGLSGPTGLSGMAEYEANVRKMRGIPEKRASSISAPPPDGSLASFMPPPPIFKESKKSQIFRADQEAAFNKRWKPYQDFYKSLQGGGAPLFSRQRGGVVSPDDEGLTEEEKRARLLRQSGQYAGFPKPSGAPTGIKDIESGIQFTQEQVNQLFNDVTTASQPEAKPIAQTPNVPLGDEGELERIRRLRETRATTATPPITEGTATVESRADYLKRVGEGEGEKRATQEVFDRWAAERASTPEGMELEARKKWATPGYAEERLAEARKVSPLTISPYTKRVSGAIGVSPGYEKSYYGAHPEELAEERRIEMAERANKPMIDAYMKLMEEAKRRAEGSGLMGLSRRGQREARVAAAASIPQLAQGLEKLRAIPETRARREEKPQLVQTDKGYMWVTAPTQLGPGGALPTGIMGRAPTEALPSFQEYKRIPGNETKTYDDFRRWEASVKEREMATSGLREFEIATGIDPTKRGTPEYSESYMKFLTGKKQATQITDPIQQQKLGITLRKEFNALQPVKDYRDIENRFNIMGKAIEEAETTKNFVAVDQALITIFNKMTDPQSVVRESEYLRTPQDLALWNRIKGKVSKMAAGGAGLTSDDRNALFSMANQFKNVYESKFNQLRNEYRGYAIDYGLDPEMVIKGRGGEERQTIGGKSYIKLDGKWYEE